MSKKASPILRATSSGDLMALAVLGQQQAQERVYSEVFQTPLLGGGGAGAQDWRGGEEQQRDEDMPLLLPSASTLVSSVNAASLRQRLTWSWSTSWREMKSTRGNFLRENHTPEQVGSAEDACLSHSRATYFSVDTFGDFTHRYERIFKHDAVKLASLLSHYPSIVALALQFYKRLRVQWLSRNSGDFHRDSLCGDVCGSSEISANIRDHSTVTNTRLGLGYLSSGTREDNRAALLLRQEHAGSDTGDMTGTKLEKKSSVGLLSIQKEVLYSAVFQAQFDCLHFLCHPDTNPFYHLEEPFAAFILAVRLKSSRMAQILLLHPAIRSNINQNDATGYPVMKRVAHSMNVRMMKLLLDNGSQMKFGDNNALLEACSRGDLASVDLVLSYPQGQKLVNEQREGSGDTALHYAVELQNLVLIHTLLDFGADAGRKNRDFETPIYIATIYAARPLPAPEQYSEHFQEDEKKKLECAREILAALLVSSQKRAGFYGHLHNIDAQRDVTMR